MRLRTLTWAYGLFSLAGSALIGVLATVDRHDAEVGFQAFLGTMAFLGICGAIPLLAAVGLRSALRAAGRRTKENEDRRHGFEVLPPTKGPRR